MLSPVSIIAIAISVMLESVLASKVLLPKNLKASQSDCPKTQIKPPVKNAKKQSFKTKDLLFALSTSLEYSLFVKIPRSFLLFIIVFQKNG